MALATQSILYTASDSSYLAISDANFGTLDLDTFAVYCRFKLTSGGDNTVRPIIRQQAALGGAISVAITVTSANRIDFFVSNNGTSAEGQLTTNATYDDTDGWISLLVHWDRNNATAGDRMKMWVGTNGNTMTEITSFFADINPTNAMNNSTAFWRIGYNGANTQHFDGYMYQLAYLDGVLPAHTVFEDAGESLDIASETGLHSFLNVPGGTITDDGVLTANWIASTTAPVASNDIPEFASTSITGTAVTGSVGTVAEEVTKGLTGVAGIGNFGTPSITVADTAVPTGVVGTGAVDTPVLALSHVPNTVAGTGASGSPTATTATIATTTGNVGTGNVGTVASSGTATLTATGVAGIGATDTPLVEVVQQLSGVAATGQVEAVFTLVAELLTGVTGAGAANIVTDEITKATTGVEATGAIGTAVGLAPTIAVPTGVAAVGAAGTATVILPTATANVSGVTATMYAGTVNANTIVVSNNNVFTVAAGVRSFNVAAPTRTFNVTAIT